MFKNYLKTAWRNLMKSKMFSLINILGLTIGITVCMMIFLFIMNEFSVDNFHTKGKKIYRVMRGYDSSKPEVPWVSGPYADALLNDYPKEIKQAVRVMPSNGLISFGNTSFNEKKLYITDPGFFTLFSFPLVKGDAATVLQHPNNVVLSETTAKKYFGDADPIGKTLQLDKERQLTVIGIAKDAPSNSHLDFDMVIPMTIYYNEPWFKTWINNNNYTYLLLDENASEASVEKTFPQFMHKYGKDMEKSGYHFFLKLTPLKDIYFEPTGSFSNGKHGDKTVVYIFLSIAALILLIACINFMNLSTIRAVERSKEVGLRKVLGAMRNHLVWQFIGESVLLTLLSTAFAIGLLQLLMPYYNSLLGYQLTTSWKATPIYLFLLGIIVVVGLLAGSYPAIVLSAFSPIQALKGKLRLGKGGSFFRHALVVVQFSISVFLIIGTVVIMSQMSYVKNKELGYNKEQTIVVPIDNNEIYDHRFTFKNQLLANDNIASVSFMSGEPGGFFDGQKYEAEGQTDVFQSRSSFTDYDYVKTLGLKIIAGRDFSKEFTTDTTDAALINRTAATQLGFTPEQAIGKWLKNSIRDDKRRTIVGVIEDFNFLSLKENMDALIITPGRDNRVAVIRFKNNQLSTAIDVVRKEYSKVAPVYPFEYRFLDQQFDELYKADLRQQKLLSLFAGLAIFIACLGLFGLASFTTTKRIKEIGVRKVLGSSVQSIVLLLSKDLLKPVLMATLIAIPAGYYAMNSWLQNFAYRTTLNWQVFVLAAFITIGIAIITVSFKAIKAALNNPIKSLRTE